MLTSIAPSLWAADHELRLPAGVRLPVRATIARLSDGSLWVHSPTPLTDSLHAEVSALGPVAYLVSPSRLHHLWAGDWQRRFPEAELHAALGVAEKRPDLRIARTLGRDRAGFAAEIATLPVDGAPSLDEHVFVHRATRTLIVSDLVFNVLEPRNLPTSLVLRLMGTRGKLAKSRAWKRAVKDRAAHEASLRRILAEDFDRLVVGHGEHVASGARGALSRVLQREGGRVNSEPSSG